MLNYRIIEFVGFIGGLVKTRSGFNQSLKHSMVFLFASLFFVTSCSPSESQKATIVADALQQTNSSLPTKTETDSPTLEDTKTPTITLSRTPTPTETPLPPITLTAVAAGSTATAAANFATATKQQQYQEATDTANSKNATATEKSGIATATQQAKNSSRTATARVVSAHKTEIASYSPISRRELVTYPDSHYGERVVIRGRIFNINGNTELQIWMDDSYDAIYIVMAEPFTGIYEGDYITVYGIVYGEDCGTNAYGAETCQPVLIAAFFTKP